MNPPHVNKMCQNKPWTDLDLNLGRPEHIKRTCDGSIPSNARIRFMLGRRPWTAIQKREELSQDPRIPVRVPRRFMPHVNHAGLFLCFAGIVSFLRFKPRCVSPTVTSRGLFLCFAPNSNMQHENSVENCAGRDEADCSTLV